MVDIEKFKAHIDKGYTTKGDYIIMGGAMVDGESVPDTFVKAPLKSFNRHGLIAGATGTGKTKTMQGIAESLSLKGVPCLLMDIKGDLSGLAAPSAGHAKIDERHEKIGSPWEAVKFPVDFLSISKEKGARLRATVLEFGPVLFSKILDLNDTQGGVVSLVFKYCDDNKLPLVDLKDMKKVIQFITNEGKKEIQAEYGRVSTASTGAIMRKIIEIEQQGADVFFGEKSFDVNDLLKKDKKGRGALNIIRLTDIQDRPKLFSTFMLSLLAEIYSQFPEEGDIEKPKLVIFIDEAHLIFKNSSTALLDQIESIVKLIRSKAVGLFFVTQSPVDVPGPVLAQLGMKVQHALRAFTAKDRKAIKLTAENYPLSDYYDTKEELTKLGIGEALITVLSEKGIPTPLVRTLLVAPRSRMDILKASEIKAIIDNSDLVEKYSEKIDRESAHEMLTAKIENLQKLQDKEEKKSGSKKTKTRKKSTGLNSTTGRQVVRTVSREVTRGLLGAILKFLK